MKNRQGFVSNSSSSSFVISLSDITAKQLKMIENYESMAEAFDLEVCEPLWFIDTDANVVKGHTWMDNFDMRHFLNKIVEIDEDLIEWGE